MFSLQVIGAIYDNIVELSDIELQKTRWLGKDNKRISSYSEVMCRLFDDNCFDDFLDKGVFEISLSADAIAELERLKTLLNAYHEKSSDLQIIEDPKWRDISTQAQTVLRKWKLIS